MRILTWNCNGAFRRKFHLLEPFQADIHVIQECEEPTQGHTDYLRWAQQHIWTGTNKKKGLAVFARRNHTLTPLAWPDAGTSLFLPVMVNRDLQVLGVWTKVGSPIQGRYIGQFWHYLQLNRAKFDQNTIVCGDFNSNRRWDKPRKLWSHSKCVAELQSLGHVSLYHQLNGEAQGEEKTPTFFLQRNRTKSYHIDYAFAHESVLAAGSCKIGIGEPDQWLQHSDHMPIVFEI